jgi:hypothetical protein
VSIYNYDTDIISEQLTPPLLREPKQLSWISIICKPIQWLWSLVFEDYADGSNYILYNPATNYNSGNRVVFTDNKVYQNILASVGIEPTNTTNWLLINDNFIGARERIKYNSQIIQFEFHINKWFRTGIGAQIYFITNQISTSVFVMAPTGTYSSKMASSGIFATSFMATVPVFAVQYNFTVMVPIALFNSLASTNPNREKIIRQYVDKYRLAGTTYDVTTY